MVVVDAVNLGCPMPILKLKRALSVQKESVQFLLKTTDEGAKKDVPAFCQQQSLTVFLKEEKGVLAFYIKREV